jgi:hypothetical protein
MVDLNPSPTSSAATCQRRSGSYKAGSDAGSEDLDILPTNGGGAGGAWMQGPVFAAGFASAAAPRDLDDDSRGRDGAPLTWAEEAEAAHAAVRAAVAAMNAGGELERGGSGGSGGSAMARWRVSKARSAGRRGSVSGRSPAGSFKSLSPSGSAQRSEAGSPRPMASSIEFLALAEELPLSGGDGGEARGPEEAAVVAVPGLPPHDLLPWPCSWDAQPQLPRSSSWPSLSLAAAVEKHR